MWKLIQSLQITDFVFEQLIEVIHYTIEVILC